MARKTYHHGDLRAALITAGMDVLRRQGIDAVTLRTVVRKAGVSPAAAYRHFANAADLLAAIAEQGFAALGAAMVAALTDSSLAALSPLERIGQGYLKFVESHPDHFRLIFSPRIPAEARTPALAAASCASFEVLIQAIEESRKLGHVDSSLPTPLIAAAAHSFIHGLAILLLDEHLDPKQLGFANATELARACQAVFKQGWGAPSRPRSRARARPGKKRS